MSSSIVFVMPTLVASVRAEALNERQQMQTQMVRDPSPQTEFWTKINEGRGIVSAARIYARNP